MGAAAGFVGLRRQVDHGVLVEEARGREREAADDAGLNRMVFGARHVVHPEAVPEHDIGVLERAVLGDPGRQAVVAGRLVDELASRVE